MTIAFLRVDAKGAVVARCVASCRAEAVERLAPTPGECVVSAASYAAAPVRPVAAPAAVNAPAAICSRCRCPGQTLRPGRRQCTRCEQESQRRRRRPELTGQSRQKIRDANVRRGLAQRAAKRRSA